MMPLRAAAREAPLPRFVPCRTTHLVGELARLWREEDRTAFWELARVVENLYHHFASAEARLVEALYAPFDPDTETVPVEPSPRDDPFGRLASRLDRLLDRANFERVPHETLVCPADREVLARLKIDPDVDALEQVAVWVRGRGTKAVALRPFRRLFRLVEREVPTYRRVVILVRTRSDPHVVLKLFKDVPEHDLELLLPTVRVKMKLLDKVKLSGSGGAAAVSAWKLLRLVYTHAPGLAKVLAVPLQALLLPLAVLVTGVYGGKTLLDYTKIRASYITALAEHLYAITMASNAAVVARLSSMGGEEDTKEVLLAYAVLAAGPPLGLTEAELQARAEAFVWDRYRARPRFDVRDAVAKLDELALCLKDEAGRRVALPLEAALRSADHAWDEQYVPPPRGSRRMPVALLPGSEGTPTGDDRRDQARGSERDPA